jgi:hypothetical protein
MMKRTNRHRRWLAALLVAGLALTACAKKDAAEEESGGGATIEPVAGTDLSSVTLTDEAAERIGIEMAKIEGSGSEKEIPYAAVLYDPEGKTWTFTPTGDGDLSFVRSPITVDHIDGDTAFLSDGPPAGTEVVTTGAAELYGAEIGVGDE